MQNGNHNRRYTLLVFVDNLRTNFRRQQWQLLLQAVRGGR
jgi:hypothetical protein